MSGSVNAFIFQNSDMSKDQARQVWSVLKQGIEEIQSGNASSLRFEELYRNAYTLVLHKHGDLLYNGVEETIRHKLSETAEGVANTTDAFLIEAIVERWENHRLVMTMIRDILMYMDKTHCEIKKKTPVHDLGLLRFKEIVIMHEHVLIRLREELLQNIHRERQGEQIDQALMRNALHMFVEVDRTNQQPELYNMQFEEYFLEATRVFYRNESEMFIMENSVPEYLKKAEDRLDEEANRGDSYIPLPTTRFQLLKTSEHELIGRYGDDLVHNPESGCVDMFVKSKTEDLHRMYRLFSRVDQKIDLVRKSMFDYVKDCGMRIVSDEENVKNPHKFVKEVLDLREQFQVIVEHGFEDDKTFARKLKEAFEAFINRDMRAAQYLSLYTDTLLRKHASKMSESEMDRQLDNVITIFKYLSDKDIFEDFYKQQLASRLLHARNAADHFERGMIARLKAECGHQFTSKLEGMFKDIDQSRSIQEKWMNHLNASDYHPEIELDIKVLTTGFWPFPKLSPCSLPQELTDECDRFRTFYCNSHSGRRLKFDTSKGTADLEVDFPGGRKELVVQTYQMCVLMLFNDHRTLTWAQIKELSGIDSEELERHVLSLAHPKVRLLRKNPNNKSIGDDHTFTFNIEYTNPRARVYVGVLDMKKKKAAVAQGTQPPKAILEARKNRVEAAIVRIMKARKTLSHQILVTEVLRQLSSRFEPDPAFIKQRIASLIERDYLERDFDDRRMYKYLA